MRPSNSVTLPRNFIFNYTDGEPRTPDAQTIVNPFEPPPPPQYRVRRRRAPIPTFTSDATASDVHSDLPIPTIEATEDHSTHGEGYFAAAPEPVEGLLAPSSQTSRLMSPPKTPMMQTRSLDSIMSGATPDWHESDNASQTESISRPSSSCSGTSNSSASSVESFPSFGDACSPDSDKTDPFLSSPDMMLLASPMQAFSQQPHKRQKRRRDTVWLEEMDRHLWRTYMVYLQDPTVTPFKMLPGTAPPLGVCHRVAREAKRSWKTARTASASRSVTATEQRPRAGSPDTIRALKSGSNTPTDIVPAKTYQQWPRSDSATRKRLRELCKRKPSLSAHYQRLLHCRSPSPFPSSPNSGSSSSSHSGRPAPQHSSSDFGSSFSTREMNVSLATSTAASMQFGNPLSQLASQAATPKPREDVFYTQPLARTSAHQKSHSLQLGLGLNSYPAIAPRRTSNPRPSILGSDHFANPAPRLDPPAEIHAPMPLSGSLKRRAQYQLGEESSSEAPGDRQDFLQDLFGAPAATSHRRIRSRGFSLGDMSAQRLTSIFTPPEESEEQAPVEQPQQLEPVTAAPVDTSLLMAPPVPQHIRRLGSPFGGRSSNTHFNTCPRNFLSSLADPTVSIEERLEGFGN